MTKPSIVLYLHVHQPWRIKPYRVFDIAADHNYFNAHHDKVDNRMVLEKVAEKSYRPMNALLERLLLNHSEFKLSLSITGTFLEQAELWTPDVIDSFKRLIDTGRVEVVAETYEHSLAFFYSRQEFETQVNRHREIVKSLFGVVPTAFRNTELSYNNELAEWAEAKGYKTILAEGWHTLLGERSAHVPYKPVGTNKLRLLLKDYKLSDDIAFRFGDKTWSEYPLAPNTYVNWLKSAAQHGPLLNLFMDYETFGEHQWGDTGIFEFFETVVSSWLFEGGSFQTVSEAAYSVDDAGEVDAPETVTWADTERDLTAWLGNSMQQEAMRYIYELEKTVIHSDNPELIRDWRRLQTSDHAYYMCTKWFKDGDVHAYFSPYDSPYDAFVYYVNAVRDIRYRAMSSNKIGGVHG